MKAQNAILLLGGNVGDVPAAFRNAMEMLERNYARILSRSEIYATKAWGPVKQDDFLNMAIKVKTYLTPVQLLRAILSIEKQAGRKREVKMGPRTLDIDILFFAERIINTEELQVPHPEFSKRMFAMIPCRDIAPSIIHPVSEKSLDKLIAECEDRLEVKAWKK